MTMPFDMLRAGFTLARLGVEANSVIWMRMMGMGGAWNTPFDENWRMLREKPAAFMEATGRGMEAVLQGRPPAHVVMAAVAPLHRDAAENRARLEERGATKR